MATSAEIKKNIEDKRKQVSETIGEFSDLFHEKIDIKKRIRKNPYNALLAAATTGFIIAVLSGPFRKSLMKFAFTAGRTALGAYISKQSVKYITNKFK